MNNLTKEKIMQKYRIYAVVNGQDAPQVKQALDEFSAWLLSISNVQVDIQYTLVSINQPNQYAVLRPDFGGWGVSYYTTNKYNTDAVGCHVIRYFYRPDRTLPSSSLYAFTYPLQGRVQMQLPIQTFTNGVADASQILSRMKHEFCHECFANLALKGILLTDTTDVNNLNDLTNEIAVISPHWSTLCKPMRIDTLIGKAFELLGKLKLLLRATKYENFKKKWIGKSIDFDGYWGFQCLDLVRQAFKEFGIPQPPPVLGAKDIWNFYPTINYERHEISDGFNPEKGDIIVWNMKPYGHVAIFDKEIDKDNFQSLDQNWGGKPFVQLVAHRWKDVLGFIGKA